MLRLDEDIISEGKCVYCDKTFLQQDIVKHLKSHLAAQAKSYPGDETTYLLDIQAGKMFLQVAVKGNAEFAELDQFLREIWVDCCDHLSGFSYKNIEVEMSELFKDVLAPKIKFRYDYDFGTTTTLFITVAGMYQVVIEEPLLLLSRNEPLKIICTLCHKKPAVNLCTRHMYQTDNYLFCAPCSEIHGQHCEDFLDYACSPVINSPRMGICGYTGGSIDLERDDAYGI